MTQREFHRYRIEVIETWPDGPKKQAALASARAAFDRELAFEHDRSVYRLDPIRATALEWNHRNVSRN